MVTTQTRMNFPTTHPLFGGFDPNPYLTNADVVLIIDHDVPYIPAQARPKPDARIIHIDIDPLKQNFPLWGFPVDVLVQADSSKALPVLSQMIGQKITPKQRARCKGRFRQIQGEHQRMMEEWRNLATTRAAQKPISPEWLCHCVDEAIDEETIVVGEPVTNMAVLLRQVHRTRPGTYFQSGGSNLGWGLGAALGTRLASPDRTVVAMVGDGSFVFGCPTAALWAASTYHAPFLCIIFNNMQYTAPKLTLHHSLGTESYSVKTGRWVGTDIRPSPDYAAIARACYAYGKTVEDPSELPSALSAALDQVRCGQPAVLDVRVESQW